MSFFGTLRGSAARMARLVGRVLPSIAAVAVIVVLVSRLGTAPFVRAVHTLDARTAGAALLIGVLTTVASAWRWVRAARGLGLSLSVRRAVGDYYAALFLNGVLPGGVLGDVQRALRHGRDEANGRRAVTAVVVERSAGQVVLVGAVVGCLLLTPLACSGPRSSPRAARPSRPGSGSRSSGSGSCCSPARGTACARAMPAPSSAPRPWSWPVTWPRSSSPRAPAARWPRSRGSCR